MLSVAAELINVRLAHLYYQEICSALYAEFSCLACCVWFIIYITKTFHLCRCCFANVLLVSLLSVPCFWPNGEVLMYIFLSHIRAVCLCASQLTKQHHGRNAIRRKGQKFTCVRRNETRRRAHFVWHHSKQRSLWRLVYMLRLFCLNILIIFYFYCCELLVGKIYIVL